MGETAAEVGIVTADADALARFYVDGFGFAVEARYEFPQGTVHRLRREQARCKLFQPADSPAPRPPGEAWSAVAGTRYAALHVDDADEVFAAAVAAGATALQEPVSHRPGARYALVTDPEGNVWELLEEAR